MVCQALDPNGEIEDSNKEELKSDFELKFCVSKNYLCTGTSLCSKENKNEKYEAFILKNFVPKIFLIKLFINVLVSNVRKSELIGNFIIFYTPVL